MKKTIIALLSLAGVACAAPADEIAQLVSSSSYQLGDAFTLAFTIDATTFNGYVTAPVITLAEGWNINSQAGNYLGFSDTNSSVDGSLVTSSATYSSSNKNEVVGTIDVGAAGWFYKVDGLNTLTFSITESELTITKGETAVASLEINGGLDATKITTGSHITTISGLSFTTASAAVPEPSTATLSLLALAGLAVRRRRK